MMIVPRSNRFSLNLFDEFLKEPFFRRNESQVMKTDIKESDNQYIMTMELPGFAKEDIKINLENGYLTISAEKHETKEETDEKGRTIHQERVYGSCKRSFFVGEHVKQDDVKASHKDGILNLSFPKSAEKEVDSKKYIAIE